MYFVSTIEAIKDDFGVSNNALVIYSGAKRLKFCFPQITVLSLFLINRILLRDQVVYPFISTSIGQMSKY